MTRSMPSVHPDQLARLTEPLETLLRLVTEHEASYQKHELKLSELERRLGEDASKPGKVQLLHSALDRWQSCNQKHQFAT